MIVGKIDWTFLVCFLFAVTLTLYIIKSIYLSQPKREVVKSQKFSLQFEHDICQGDRRQVAGDKGRNGTKWRHINWTLNQVVKRLSWAGLAAAVDGNASDNNNNNNSNNNNMRAIQIKKKRNVQNQNKDGQLRGICTNMQTISYIYTHTLTHTPMQL